MQVKSMLPISAALSPPHLLQLAHLAVEPKLEAVAKGQHIRVLVALHLKGVGYHFYIPHIDRRGLAGLEAKVEISGTLGIEAE